MVKQMRYMATASFLSSCLSEASRESGVGRMSKKQIATTIYEQSQMHSVFNSGPLQLPC